MVRKAKSITGFTIIELGLVIIVILIITFLLTPFVKIVQEKNRGIRCRNNLEKISLAIREYAIENSEKPPQELSLLYAQGYIIDENVFDCPFSQHKGTALDPDYIYTSGFDFMASENPAIVYDKDENHKGGVVNVLYLNGEIKTIKKEAGSL